MHILFIDKSVETCNYILFIDKSVEIRNAYPVMHILAIDGKRRPTASKTTSILN